MKTSWVIGVLMIYIFIFFCEILVTNGPMFNQSSLNPLLSVSLYNSSGIIASTATFMVNIGNYIYGLIQILTLYQPTVFAGNYFYLWLFLCLPIDIGMIFSIASIIRGVHSS